MWQRLGDGLAAVTRYPRFTAWCFAALLVLIVATLWQDTRGRPLVLQLDPALPALVPDSGDAVAFYEQFRRRHGDDDLLIAVWRSPRLFTPEVLAQLREFTARVERLPGVLRAYGFANAPAVRVDEGVIEIDAWLREVPAAPAPLAALRERALADPLIGGNLLARNGEATLLAIEFDRELSPEGLIALADQVAAVSRETAGEIEHFLTGPAYVRIEISRFLRTDLARVLPIAIGGTLLVAGLAMRTLHGLVLPLLVTLGAMTTTVALFLRLGYAFNFVTVLVVPVIFIVGFAYSVHMVTAIDERLEGGETPVRAASLALRAVAGTLTMNAGLELVGFLSFLTSAIPAIRVFGAFAAVGIVVSWLGALCFVPAVLSLHAVRPARRSGRGWLGACAARVVAFDLRHRRLLLFGMPLTVLLVAAASTRIEVGTDYLAVLPERTGVARDFAQASTDFGGLVPVQVVIESDVPNLFKDPAQLAVILELQRWLAAQPEVGGVTSLVDYLAVLHRAFVPAAGSALPASRELTDQLLLLGAGNEVERFADVRFASTVLQVRAKPAASAELAALIERMEARFKELPSHMRGRVTGSAVLLVDAIDDITWGQLSSLATTALVIYAVLALIFGSLRVGALALLPNLMPIAVFFGVLGLTGLPLDVTTSLVAPIVLAIVIDDTVHFLARFNAEARRSADETTGLGRAMDATVRPVAFSTAGLIVGFLALSASELNNQAVFGCLAAFTMLVAWLIDLSFTPALASRMRFVTLWDTLSVDLGCAAPQDTIPLFHGLSARQAKTAAVLGAMLEFGPGERVQRHGGEAREIFVVVEGDLVARVPHEDGATEIRRFTRGDLIGVASLFQGRHFADVEALSKVRVLRLREACLRRIQARYPRIGAQLYRNLSAIIAQRLADVVVRV